MKKNKKPKNLVLLSVLAGLLYLYMIGSYLRSEWDDVKLGFNSGWNSAESTDFKEQTVCSPTRTFYFYVSPKNGFLSFPDSIINLKSNQKISIMHSSFKASIPRSKINDSQSSHYDFFSWLVSSMMLIICIIIPVMFYSIIGSLTNEIVFERRIINRIRTIGVSLILFYFLYMLYNYLTYKRNCQLFDFNGYTLKIDSVDPIWLLLGIVVLLIAEIISRGNALKEEQELTI